MFKRVILLFELVFVVLMPGSVLSRENLTPGIPSRFIWFHQAFFEDRHFYINLKDIDIKEDESDYSFRFKFHQSLQTISNKDLTLAVYFDTDRNKNTGIISEDCENMGSDLGIVFFFLRGAGIIAMIIEYHEECNCFWQKDLLRESDFCTLKKTLIFTISKENYTSKSGFFYFLDLTAHIDQDNRETLVYPGNGEMLIYPVSSEIDSY